MLGARWFSWLLANLLSAALLVEILIACEYALG